MVHHRELKRTTNTGRLAVASLTNSEMRVRGRDKVAMDLSDLLVPEYRTVLFYPAEDAVELDTGFLSQSGLPIQLIVPDGNWRQASKVHYRQHELKGIPHVMLRAPQNPLGAQGPKQIHNLRLETKPEGMATLEAIAQAIGVIEGAAAMAPLLHLYHLKLERTLQARGLTAKDEAPSVS